MTKYIMGCSGWYYWHWLDKFYPKDLPNYRWLEYYSKKFDSVEVNSSFYHFPSVKMLEGWYKRSPKRFIFTLKVNKMITHMKKFKGTKRLVNDFYSVASVLKEKQGAFLFQLPPNLHKNMKKLREICRQLDTRKDNFIEFRHESWFCKEVYDFLKKNKAGYCVVSCPDLPEEVLRTTENAFVRFHGKGGWYKDNYPNRLLKKWAKNIKALKAKKIYIYFNNDSNANAPRNCLSLRKMLR